jgi:VanZ family protein
MLALRLFAWALTAAYWVIIFVITHLPPSGLPRMRVSDKGAHFIGYGLLSAGLFVSLSLTGLAARRCAIVVLLIAMGYGAFDEWSQQFVRRTSELDDWLADVGGALVAVGVMWLGRVIVGRLHPAEPRPSIADAPEM